MKHAKRWSDLSPGQQTTLLVFASVELSLTSAALVDLIRRPAGQMRGRKGGGRSAYSCSPSARSPTWSWVRVARFPDSGSRTQVAAIAALAHILRANRLGVTLGRVGTFGAAVPWLWGTFGPCGRPGLTQDSETGFH